MKMFKKKKNSQVKENEKDIRELRNQLERVNLKLGIKFERMSYFWQDTRPYFVSGSPIVILQEKADLILEHLGLEYKSTEERAQDMKGKLYKKSQRKK